KICAQYAYQVGSSFEASMSQVEAISGASSQQLDLLTEKAKALGASTRFTATESAQAMNYMAMAGWDAQQMLSGIDGVLSLAAASGSDLATTADIVTDALTAFGLKAEDVGHFSDVLAAASANANTNVSMLGESFRYVAPLAGTMGYTIDETAEALGIMANSGIKASTAGTSMRTMLTNLASGAKITSEAFGELEISAANSDGSMKSLNELLGELREAFSQMTDQEKTMNATTIAGDRAMSGFLALMNAGADDINKLRSAIEGADGAAASMADTMQKNTAGSVTVLNSAIEALGIAVYEKFGGELNDFVQNITEAVTSLKDSIDDGELSETFDRLGESFGELTDDIAEFARDTLPVVVEGAAKFLTTLIDLREEIGAGVKAFIAYKSVMALGSVIGSVKTAISGLTTALSGATVAQTALNTAAAATPWGLIAAAAAGFVFVVSEIAANAETAEQKVSRLTEATQDLNNTANKSRESAKALDELVEEYKKLKTTAGETNETKQQLIEIQKTLCDTYGFEAQGIDLVNGEYERQLELLGKLSGMKNEFAAGDAAAAYYNYLDSEAAQKGVSYFYGLNNFLNADDLPL
ncbi:MAG: phage tail tape measure protein, partial [Oscillospiraceae bacterium]